MIVFYIGPCTHLNFIKVIARLHCDATQFYPGAIYRLHALLQNRQRLNLYDDVDDDGAGGWQPPTSSQSG